MKTDSLNFKRLGLLFRRFFIERSRYELIQWITMMIVFMFLRNNSVGMTMAILISGVVYASNFFKDIHSRGNGAAYFMIPASQLEKTIVGVVMTSFYYLAMIIVAYLIGNLLGTFLNNMLAGINILPGFSPFHHSPLQWHLFSGFSDPFVNINVNGDSKFLGNTFSNHLYHLFCLFLIGQSIYMLGSIYFKRNHFLATFLAVFVIQLLLFLLFAAILRLVFGINNGQISTYEWGMMVGKILKSLLWLLAPFFWVVSYFRLSEKQI